MEKLLTSRQMADILGIKLYTLYKWTSKKMIPFLKIGYNVRFDEDVVKKWIRDKRVKCKTRK